ncbi:hypothetical protein A3K73_00870 [Candidatus Pacearchaeota archaeon RBG_13_36_9]|nr:MAG: hypothetical protein A3K73_00870 [Candidatus Pacearchaeota archaeon RBG_13_36_9]
MSRAIGAIIVEMNGCLALKKRSRLFAPNARAPDGIYLKKEKNLKERNNSEGDNNPSVLIKFCDSL